MKIRYSDCTDCGAPVLRARGKRWRCESCRFWHQVHRSDKPGDCWLWMSRWAPGGYGMFGRDDRTRVRAHRYAYEQFRGPIPDGLVIDHLCRMTLCVNPDHLEVVTHQTNILRGVGMGARWAVRDRCEQGHPFTEENTIVRSDGGRRCRTCFRAFERERSRRRRAEGRH